MRSLARLLGVVVVAGLCLALGVAGLAPQARALLTAGEAKAEPIQDLEPLSTRSVVYAADGSVIAVLHAEENRQPVALRKISKALQDSVIAVEDNRFWTHNGVDVRGTLRALYTNVEAGALEQGGSTITQQLVKNTLLTSKKDAKRKLQEAALAIRLEKKLSKDEILERYLNTVYFGNGAYGAQAAAERYFGIEAAAITPLQASLLAGMIRNPSGYDPFTHPDDALHRRAFALRRMAAAGVIRPDEVEAMTTAPLPSKPIEFLPRADGGTGYFLEEVKQELLDDERLGDTGGERYNAVFKGGLQIHTTLDPKWEQAALDAVSTIVPDTGGRFTAALVSVDSSTGAVRALVGGPGFEQAKFNLATQGRRQAGSSFKPFTLATALDQGHSPTDSISGSSPCTIPNPGGEPDPWRPQNNEGEAAGTISLTKATALSVNCAYARLAMIVGIDNVAETARNMGITTKLEPTPAMTLGALKNGVSPLEMASAYATLAAEGVHREPYLIEKVEDRDGKTIVAAKHTGKRVLSPQIARTETQMLQQVLAAGTGTRARVPGRDIAGKTGTANDYVDAWFVGFTPQLSTAVWMGAPVGEVPMRNVGGIRVFGGTYPARIFSSYMARALADLPVERFTPPDPKQIPRGTYLRLRTEAECRRARSRAGSSRRSSVTTTPCVSSGSSGSGSSGSGSSRSGSTRRRTTPPTTPGRRSTTPSSPSPSTSATIKR